MTTTLWAPAVNEGEQHRQHGLHLKLWSLLLGSPSSARIPEGKEQGGNNYIYNPYIHLLAPCQLDPLTLVSPESWDGWVDGCAGEWQAEAGLIAAVVPVAVAVVAAEGRMLVKLLRVPKLTRTSIRPPVSLAVSWLWQSLLLLLSGPSKLLLVPH